MIFNSRLETSKDPRILMVVSVEWLEIMTHENGFLDFRFADNILSKNP